MMGGVCAVVSDEARQDAESDDGLAAGLAGLSHLLAGTSSFDAYLGEVAKLAVLAVPGADGAGVTMIEAGRPDTIVASDPFVRDVDAIQYRLGEGPCISAASTGKTVATGGLGEDELWPAFGPMAADLGIHSAISLPLVLDGEVLGALNVYAYAHDAFDQSSRLVGELFAGPAAVALHNARVLDEARRTSAKLQVALDGRSTVDRAVGIVMSRSGHSADDAYLRLRLIGQREQLPLVEVAGRLVKEAVRHALARQQPDD
jgi:GAF domain-containing protein